MMTDGDAGASTSGGEKVVHNGGCHCGGVRFRARAERRLVAWDCNCSICAMKRNVHFIVPEEDFELLRGGDLLNEYAFGEHVARHRFCRTCGVQSFFHPRSNPNGVGVTVGCVDDGTIDFVEVRPFDGRNWDYSYQTSNIAACSVAS